jgi:hypothetical protein
LLSVLRTAEAGRDGILLVEGEPGSARAASWKNPRPPPRRGIHACLGPGGRPPDPGHAPAGSTPESLTFDRELVWRALAKACSNASEHAYAGERCEQVRLTVQICGPRLGVVGGGAAPHAAARTWTGRAPDDGGRRGRDLPMMRTFVDDVALEPSSGGATVRTSRIVC